MQVHGFTQNGAIEITIDGTRMSVPNDPANRHRQLIAEWEALGNVIPPYVAPVLDLSQVDQDTLNAALAAEGSVVRALALVMLQEINTIRTKLPTPLSTYTQAQLVAALKAKMR